MLESNTATTLPFHSEPVKVKTTDGHLYAVGLVRNQFGMITTWQPMAIMTAGACVGHCVKRDAVESLPKSKRALNDMIEVLAGFVKNGKLEIRYA